MSRKWIGFDAFDALLAEAGIEAEERRVTAWSEYPLASPLEGVTSWPAINQMVEVEAVAEAEDDHEGQEVFDPHVGDEYATLEYKLWTDFMNGDITHYELEAELRRHEELAAFGEILPHTVGQLSLGDVGLDL